MTFLRIFDELSNMYCIVHSSICFNIAHICLSLVISKSKFLRDVSTFLSKLDAPNLVLNLEPRWKAIGLWSFVSWHVFWPLLDVVTSAKCHFDRFSFSAVVVMGFIVMWTSWPGFWTRPFQICQRVFKSSFTIAKHSDSAVAGSAAHSTKCFSYMIVIVKQLIDSSTTLTWSSWRWHRIFFFLTI